MSKTTTDRFLDCRLLIEQPTEGFRAGLDAVMLAAAVPAKPGERVLELGSGVGTAALCLAATVMCSVTGVEIDRASVLLARKNALANGLAERARFVHGNATTSPREIREEFAHVFSNPPFHDSDGSASPNMDRRRAMQDWAGLGAWITAGLRRTRSGGTFTMIIRADRLAVVLGRVLDNQVTIFPLWPRKEKSPKRVIVRIRKERGVGFTLLPGLSLHSKSGKYTREAEAVLRGRSRLDLSPRA